MRCSAPNPRDGALFRTVAAVLTEREIGLLMAEIARETGTFALDGEVRGPGVALLLSGIRSGPDPNPTG